MNIKTISLGLLILTLSCRSASKTETNTEEKPEVSQPIAASIIPLPDMNFDLDQFREKEIRNGHLLSASEQQKLQVSEIDRPIYQDDISEFQYYFLKEMYKGKEGKILLLSRRAEMEAFAWLVSYDKQDRLIDYLQIYYDEWAESAVNNTSVIRNDSISIRKYKMDLETGKEHLKTIVFQIDNELKFKEMKPY